MTFDGCVDGFVYVGMYVGGNENMYEGTAPSQGNKGPAL